MKISKKARNAIYLGLLCSIAYFAVYIARNILSAATPLMLSTYTEEYIGKMSSLFLGAYAIGQLINGLIGDKVRPKYMICLGLFFSAVTNVAFVFLPGVPNLALWVYALTGFFLSMIYAPMTRMVADSTDLVYATRCGLGYTLASFFGSPAAGVLAAIFTWQLTFIFGSAALALMAIICFLTFSLFEKKGIIVHREAEKDSKKNEKRGFKDLLDRGIVEFSLVSAITGIIRTSVVFWLPTYLFQYLGYTEKSSAAIFSVATLIVSSSAIFAVLISTALKNDIYKALTLYFTVSAICFGVLYFVKAPIVNIILIVAAILASNCASSTVWVIYCPSLKQTGHVSGITGFLDFLCYAAAAVANILFADAVSSIGWGNLILVWCAIVVLGTVTVLPAMLKRKRIM